MTIPSLKLPRFCIGVLAGLLAVAPSFADAPSRFVVTPTVESLYGNKFRRDFRKKYTESNDQATINRVRKVGRRLISASDRPGFPYRFLVYESEELQSYALPGGTICVSSAISRTFVSDDELAFVLAHEIAHIALRHHMIEQRIGETLDSESLKKLKSNKLDRESRDKLLQEVVLTSLGPTLEKEADKYGALYVVRAGYALSSAYKVIEQVGGSTTAVNDPHGTVEQRKNTLKKLEGEIGKQLGYFEEGVESLKNGEPGKAAGNFALFITNFPNDSAALINLGSAHLAILRAASGTPDNLGESLPILQGPVIELRGGAIDPTELEDARFYFQKALDLNDFTYEALAGLALVKIRSDELTEARELLKRASDQDRKHQNRKLPDLALCLGNVEYIEEDFLAAQKQYQKALNLRADWPLAIKNLAMTAEKLNRTDRACKHWTDLLNVEGFQLEARQHLDELGCPEAVRD